MINQRNRAIVISWLSNYISANPHVSTDYRDVIHVLKKDQQYYIKCLIADNKYLYGTFISEAKNLANKLTLSEPMP